MHVIFVTGSDTGIGKTHVTAALARLLAPKVGQLQIVKPVETGRTSGQPGDAAVAADLSGQAGLAIFTPVRFSQPMAPLAAAVADGETLDLPRILEEWHKLPPADLRIVEGAGGIAVPLDPSGADWADFATAIGADRIVLVVPDRLGAINQARLTAAYAQRQRLRAGIWLNEHESQPEEIRRSNRIGILQSHLPLWGIQHFGETEPEDPASSLVHLLP
jgi:dethiobiotin synthase